MGWNKIARAQDPQTLRDGDARVQPDGIRAKCEGVACVGKMREINSEIVTRNT
jgi:hypothetical protein